MKRTKWKIAVLCGGDSSEREISLQTGEAVATALDERGHFVRLVDVRGRTLDELNGFDCDLAFIALHGAFGEDGQVQLLLEMRGIPYTGSGVEASRLAMDKPQAKERFAACGLLTPEGTVVRDDAPRERVRAAVVRMGFPQIIKPAREGSSIGVTLARSVPEAMKGLEICFELDDRALIERRIRGRELNVAILGRRALPIIEVLYPGEIFDTHAKYTPGVARHVVRPKLPDGAADRVRAAALAAHAALGCRDLSRVEILLDETGQPYVLEVNTIPGMTATSLVPEAARAAGIEFGELCETLARLAVLHAATRGTETEQGASECAFDERR